MANTTSRPNDRNDRSRRDDRGDESKPEPWNVVRVREREMRNGDKRTDWLPCGTAWPMKDGKPGFTIDIDWTIPEGSRLAIMPRKKDDDR